MRLTLVNIWGQVYLLPFVKLTHNRALNGDLEFIVGWLKWEVVIGL